MRGPWAGATLSQQAGNRLKRREDSKGQIDAIPDKISRACGLELDNT